MSEAVDLYSNGVSRASRLVAGRIEVVKLQPGPKVRLVQVNREHVDALALGGGDWPPIVVRRADNTIIDGYHRVLAARQLGHTHLDCLYFEGGPEAAFLEALRCNLTHGLPLSLRERAVAARRVLAVRPEWSDRKLGELCGLAPATVGRLRGLVNGRPAAQREQVNARVGRDGKRYPIDRSASRSRIVSALQANPERSLRSVAQATGTSPATVRAVKAQLSGPVTSLKPSVDAGVTALPSTSTDAIDAAFTAWFERTSVDDKWKRYVGGIPAGLLSAVAEEAERRADEWAAFANAIHDSAARSDGTSSRALEPTRAGSLVASAGWS